MRFLNVLIVLILVLFSCKVFPQGTLKGVITDSTTENSLVGANVFLVGTSLGSAANIEGEYSIYPIPAGTHTVKVSYIGYRSKES
jgi:hypothetical protein